MGQPSALEKLNGWPLDLKEVYVYLSFVLPEIVKDFLNDFGYFWLFSILLCLFLHWLMGRKGKRTMLMEDYYLTETLPQMRARWMREEYIAAHRRRA